MTNKIRSQSSTKASLRAPTARAPLKANGVSEGWLCGQPCFCEQITAIDAVEASVKSSAER
eukprot:6186343-Pleurochrysis_carterae.AAC.1